MKYIVSIIIACLMLNMNVLALDENEKNPTVEVNPPRLVNAQPYNQSVISKNINYTNDYIDVDIKIPIIKYGNKITEKSMNKELSKEILELEEKLNKEAKENYTDQKDGEFRKYSFKTDFQVEYENRNIISIIENIYYYTGGAHDMILKNSYNFDMNTGNLIYLKDLFKNDVDYRKIIVDEVKEEINKEPGLYYDNVASSINGIPINQRFYLTKDGIIIYYDLYDIAPYVSGIREFTIPYSKVKDMLKEDISVKVDNVMINKNEEVKVEDNINEYIYYPQMENLKNPIIQNKINTIIKNDIKDFISKSKNSLNGSKIGVSVYNIDYFLNDNIISLDLTYSANDGTVTNYILYDKGYNLDLTTGENYKLKDVFKDNFDYVTNINNIIKKEIEKNNSNSEYKYDYNFKSIKENQEYYIYRGNLVVMFEAGEILSKDFGNVKFYIPMSIFDNNVNPIFKEK